MIKRRPIIDSKAIIDFYESGNYSIPQVAKQFGCGATTVRRRLEQNNITIRSFEQVMSGRKLTPEHRKKVLETLEYGQKGTSNPNWKGGVTYSGRKKNGLYMSIRYKGRYIKEHRYVMELHLGRRLLSAEHVHHINGIKTDNRVENLVVMSASEHAKLHNADPLLKAKKSQATREARAKKFWSSRSIVK